MNHDYSKPYTEEELEEIRNICRKLPSYKNEGGVESFMADDLLEMMAGMSYKRTPEGVAVIQQFWRNHYDGVVPLIKVMNVVRNLHDTSTMGTVFAKNADTDENGFISLEEFDEMMKIVKVHDPTQEGVSYEKFLKEADTNLGGKISIEECADWLNLNLQKPPST